MYRWITQFTHTLEHVDKIVSKAEAYAKGRSIDPAALLHGRLAPDMYTFIQQVQAMTDTATFAAARLSGQEAPSFPDTEQTFEEIHERVTKAIGYLEEFEASDFEGWEEREISLPFAKDHYALGVDYLHQFVIPNFYFHVTTAYGILRHNGLEIGKQDYIGFMTLHPVEE